MCIEVKVTSLHPLRLCRIAVISIKLTFPTSSDFYHTDAVSVQSAADQETMANLQHLTPQACRPPLFLCCLFAVLWPQLPRPSDLVQGVAYTTAFMPLRIFAQTTLFSVSPSELPTHVPPPKSVVSKMKDKDIHELECGVLREASAREAAAGNLPKMICTSN